MAKKIDRPFIRVHENMPEHPKIEPLSDKAFRLLVETWCWAKRTGTNGHVRDDVWKRRGNAKARAELMQAGLVDDDLFGGVIVHDFDDWQMTTDDIAEQSEQAARAAHERWHVKEHKPNPDCAHCKAHSFSMQTA